MKIKFSIIIPTWNRKSRLVELLNTLIKINKNYNDYEILICDSNSTDNTEISINEIIKKNKLNNIKIYHAKYNNVAQKRNLGITNSFYDHIILIDDDCVPLDDFFTKYEDLCKKKIGKKIIFSGMYLTEQNKILSSNYSKYRDSRNYKINKFNNKEIQKINFWQIVTGNLCFEKKIILENKILFNEEITGYGFEDVDWGYRVYKNDIQIVKIDIGVIHNETSSDINNYKLKWYYQAKTGMPLLIRENLNAAKKLPLYFLEKNIKINIYQRVIKIFINYIMNNFFAFLIENYLVLTDRYKIFYFPILFKILLVYYYCLGIKNRDDKYIQQDDTKKNWFMRGYK